MSLVPLWWPRGSCQAPAPIPSRTSLRLLRVREKWSQRKHLVPPSAVSRQRSTRRRRRLGDGTLSEQRTWLRFSGCWSRSLLALLSSRLRGQANAQQPCWRGATWAAQAGLCEAPAFWKRVCPRLSSCGGDHIYSPRTATERINELQPIWRFERVRHNKNAKHEHDFIPSLFPSST